MHCQHNNPAHQKPARRAFVQTIKKTKDFKATYKRGRYVADIYFAMYVAKNTMGHNRVGLSVSKRVGNAVSRNRVRRIIKESFRLSADRANQGFDIVIVARTAAGEVKKEGSFFLADKSLTVLMKKLGMFND